MADDVLIARFQAELDGITAEFEKYLSELKKVQKEEGETQADIKKTALTAEEAAKRRTKAIKAEEAEIKKLTQARKLAFDPKTIDSFNQKISESQKRISLLKGETESFGKGLETRLSSVGSLAKSALIGVGSGIAAAFSISKIADFAKASADAFIEAEKNAQQLKFAITQVIGESDQVFERLIRQSGALQDISIFSDDSIQQAQTALANFGLVGNQIEELIPKIINLASANKIDLATATDSVIKGIEGQTRGLALMGLKFESTGDALQDYNILLKDLDKFTGAAADATTTLNGQLEQSKNRFDDLQEFVGSKLAGIFTAAKVAIYEAIGALLDFDNSVDQVSKRASSRFDKDVAARVNKLKEQGKTDVQILADLEGSVERTSSIRRRAQAEFDLFTKALTAAGSTERDLLIEARGLRIEDIAVEQQRLEQVLVIAKAQESAYKDQVSRIKGSIDLKERELTLDEIKAASLENLTKLLKENQGASDIISKTNIERIKTEIETREKLSKKAAEEEAKLRDKALADAQKRSAEELKDLQDSNDQALKELADLIARADKKKKEAESLFEFKIRFVAATQGAETAFIQARDELFKIYEQEVATAKVTSDTVVEENTKKQKAYEDYITKVKGLLKSLGIEEEITAEDSVKDVEESLELRYQKELEAASNLVNSLSALYSVFGDRRLNEIEEQKNAEIEAIDAALEANEEALKKGRISQVDAAKQEQLLLDAKVKAEEDAAKKEREIKRKQAILDKAAALIEITISTAKAIAEAAPIVPLEILAAATGAAQAAIVLATPIPYKKGTKSAKGGLSNVDEEGAEAIIRPGQGRLTTLEKGTKVVPFKQTTLHAKAIDSMIDDRFEDFVLYNYVNPALVRQKRENQKAQAIEYAESISNSITVNQGKGMGLGELDYLQRRGTKINNVDDFAYAIGRQLKSDPFRR